MDQKRRGAVDIRRTKIVFVFVKIAPSAYRVPALVYLAAVHPHVLPVLVHLLHFHHTRCNVQQGSRQANGTNYDRIAESIKAVRIRTKRLNF